MKDKIAKSITLALAAYALTFALSTCLYETQRANKYHSIKIELCDAIAGKNGYIDRIDARNFLDARAIETPINEDDVLVINDYRGNLLGGKPGFSINLWDGQYSYTYPPAAIPLYRQVGKISLEEAQRYIENHKK